MTQQEHGAHYIISPLYYFSLYYVNSIIGMMHIPIY